MIRACAGVLLVALIGGHPARAGDRPDPDEAKLVELVPLLQQHKGAEALDRLAPLIAENDRKIEAARATGLVYCATDLAETLSYTMLGATQRKHATVLLPSVCHALYLKAYALNDLGRRAEGTVMLERLIDLAPMHAQYFSELAYTYNTSGRPDLAEKTYRKALDYIGFAQDEAIRKHHRAVAWRGIGYALVEKQDLDGAEAAYRESLKDEPDNPLAKKELDFIASRRQRAG